jgi:hypothetical protein
VPGHLNCGTPSIGLDVEAAGLLHDLLEVGPGTSPGVYDSRALKIPLSIPFKPQMYKYVLSRTSNG